MRLADDSWQLMLTNQFISLHRYFWLNYCTCPRMAKFGEDGLVPDRLFEKASVDSSLDSKWFDHVHDFGICWLKVRSSIQWFSLFSHLLPIVTWPFGGYTILDDRIYVFFFQRMCTGYTGYVLSFSRPSRQFQVDLLWPVKDMVLRHVVKANQIWPNTVVICSN